MSDPACGGARPSDYRPLAHEPSATGLEGSPIRENSSRVFRVASETLTGGAAVLPPPPLSLASLRGESAASGIATNADSGNAVVRRASTRREVRQEEVQQRMVDELLRRFRLRIIMVSTALFLLSIVMLVLVLWGFAASLFCGDMPCDQPMLKYYFWATFFMAYMKQSIFARWREFECVRGHWRVIFIGVARSLPSWCVIVWGVHMIGACRTCQETNPQLYYATKYFIAGQIVFMSLTQLFFSVGLRPILRYLTTLGDRMSPGCQAAVRNLPKVPNESQELIDPDDGLIIDCPICADTLSRNVVVRTPCEHYFHEDCLAQWCRNHVDCPMCRQEVGKPIAVEEL
mmetsp:Transcript_38085/g.104832  ORF Transcript_38085/g.104832 Transcript_38085/m.104832 type:complete len:344 (+) Transcript_38085:81-1112(+)